MKLKINESSLSIEAETPQDIAFFNDTLCLGKGDKIEARRLGKFLFICKRPDKEMIVDEKNNS